MYAESDMQTRIADRGKSVKTLPIESSPTGSQILRDVEDDPLLHNRAVQLGITFEAFSTRVSSTRLRIRESIFGCAATLRCVPHHRQLPRPLRPAQLHISVRPRPGVLGRGRRKPIPASLPTRPATCGGWAASCRTKMVL